MIDAENQMMQVRVNGDELAWRHIESWERDGHGPMLPQPSYNPESEKVMWIIGDDIPIIVRTR